MNVNPRIVATDSIQDCILKLANGIPGALTVMLTLVSQAGDISFLVLKGHTT
jgi:hypothetical protein